MTVAHEGLDLLAQLRAWLVTRGRHHERLDDVAAPLIRRGDGGGLGDGGMLQAG